MYTRNTKKERREKKKSPEPLTVFRKWFGTLPSGDREQNRSELIKNKEWYRFCIGYGIERTPFGIRYLPFTEIGVRFCYSRE